MSWSTVSKLKQAPLKAGTSLPQSPHSSTTDLRQRPMCAKSSLWWGRQSYAQTTGARRADQ